MTRENELVNAHAELAKALAARRAARALAELELYDDASSRLYYAAFHLISAALLTLGVQAQTHGGLATLLGQHLVRPGLVPAQVGRGFAALMGLRGQADHNRHFVIDREGFAAVTTSADAVFSALDAFLSERGVQPE
ncbi:MAG: HEPN domain-containing protein [Polyangiaceae bacterium]|nr:HEPN domain-containing protein [Polyangiaceae bacterium]